MSIQQYTTSAPMTPWAGGPWVRSEDHKATMANATKLLQKCHDAMEADGWGGDDGDGYNLRAEVKAWLKGE